MSAESWLADIDRICSAYRRNSAQATDADERERLRECAIAELANLKPKVERSEATRWLHTGIPEPS